jgi:hypothetical protein
VEAVRLEYVKSGMLIRSKNGANIVYVVTANYGTRLTAVRSVDITNPNEWEVAPNNKDMYPKFEDLK